MLVKEFLETYRKQSMPNDYTNYKGLRFVVCCGEEAKTELCSSENIDWLVKTFGWRVISSWSINPGKGVILTLKNGADVVNTINTERYIKKPVIFTTTIGTGETREVNVGTGETHEVNAGKELTNEEFLKSLKTQEPSKYDEEENVRRVHYCYDIVEEIDNCTNKLKHISIISRK